MLEKGRSLGDLHARMRAVQGGLFRAEYSGEINPESSDARDIPGYHVSTSPEDVKIWVEQMAQGLGYDRAFGMNCHPGSWGLIHALQASTMD
jgi:hypothetical protein